MTYPPSTISIHYKIFAHFYYKKYTCKICKKTWSDCPFHKLITDIFVKPLPSFHHYYYDEK